MRPAPLLPRSLCLPPWSLTGLSKDACLHACLTHCVWQEPVHGRARVQAQWADDPEVSICRCGACTHKPRRWDSMSKHASCYAPAEACTPYHTWRWHCSVSDPKLIMLRDAACYASTQALGCMVNLGTCRVRC